MVYCFLRSCRTHIAASISIDVLVIVHKGIGVARKVKVNGTSELVHFNLLRAVVHASTKTLSVKKCLSP